MTTDLHTHFLCCFSYCKPLWT